MDILLVASAFQKVIWPAFSQPGDVRVPDIRRMTSVTGPRLAQIGVIGKTGPWRMVTAMRQSLDVCAWFAENVDFVFIKAQFSLGFG
jgi:hypothetical protein